MNRAPRVVAASIAGHLFRLIPYKRRLAAALAIARFIPARRYRSEFETVADARARILVRTMAYANVPFPNDVIVRGAEELKAPAILVSAHLFLNALLLRFLIERGHRLAIPRATPPDPPWLAGSSIPLENLLVTPAIFVTLRRRLAEGEIAFVNVDGPEGLSDSAIRFARKLGIPLYFAATRLHGAQLVAEIRSAGGNTIETVMEQLESFLMVARTD